MTVRMIREEVEEEAPRAGLRLVAPEEPVEAPEVVVPPPVQAALMTAPTQQQAIPPEEISLQQRQSVLIQSIAILTALEGIVSIRLSLILTIICAAMLTAFAEAQHERQTLAVVAAGLFTVFALIPMVALANRKG